MNMTIWGEKKICPCICYIATLKSCLTQSVYYFLDWSLVYIALDPRFKMAKRSNGLDLSCGTISFLPDLIQLLADFLFSLSLFNCEWQLVSRCIGNHPSSLSRWPHFFPHLIKFLLSKSRQMNDPVILEFSFEHETKNWYTKTWCLCCGCWFLRFLYAFWFLEWKC